MEFPYAFASALQKALEQQRLKKERALASGRFGWMDAIMNAPATEADGAIRGGELATAAAAASGDADDPNPARPNEQQQQQQGQGQQQQQGQGQGQHKPKVDVTVQVHELEETFSGRINLLVSANQLKPLRSGRRRLMTSSAAAAAAAGKLAAGSSGKAAGALVEAAVRSGRPLFEVIAAANAALEDKYERSIAAGLRELCYRLRVRETNSPPPPPPPPAAAAAAAGQGAAGKRVAGSWDAAAAGVGRGSGGIDPRTAVESEQQAAVAQKLNPGHDLSSKLGAEASTQTAVTSGGGGASAGQQAQGLVPEGSDVYTLLSLLRRLQLWPVSVDLLRSTGAGKQVAALKLHPDAQISALATQVVNSWKQAVKAEQARKAAAAAAAAAADAAASGGGERDRGSGGKQQGGHGTNAAVADEGLRARVRVMLRDALVDHLKAVADYDHVEIGPSDRLPELSGLSEQLEQQVYELAEAAAAAGARRGSSSGPSAGGLADYKARARVLATGLRHRDGVSPQLLGGEVTPEEVRGADPGGRVFGWGGGGLGGTG